MSKRKILIDYLPSVLTGMLIIYFAIIKEQSFFKTLPTLITLVVQILNVSANRFAFLLGGTNAVIYALSYISEGVYFSFFSALFISAPIQFYSFINWSIHADKKSTALKKASVKKLCISFFGIIAGWGICYFILTPFFKNAAYPILDSFGFSMGIAVSLLAARRYIQSQYMNIISCLVSTIMWILIAIKEPSDFNYAIISFYNLFRVIESSVIWTKKYIKQDRELHT